MTRSEFKPLLLFLAKGCRVEFDREQVLAWYASLCDLPADAVTVAMARFVCQCGKWPDIATVRRFAVAALHGESKPWSEALEDARKAVRRFGAHGQADARKSLDDVTWKAIQAIGGWQKLCDWRTDRSDILNAQFRDSYRDITERADARRALPQDIRPTLAGRQQTDGAERWLSRKAGRLLSLLTESFSKVLDGKDRNHETPHATFAVPCSTETSEVGPFPTNDTDSPPADPSTR
ncbi:MAG: hypothetical protein HQ518_00665 [Rhodopirellula sp.]|nr:hypothetical protein [Rhodopirellula sp.]